MADFGEEELRAHLIEINEALAGDESNEELLGVKHQLLELLDLVSNVNELEGKLSLFPK